VLRPVRTSLSWDIFNSKQKNSERSVAMI
jgi:hypothetical protein